MSIENWETVTQYLTEAHNMLGSNISQTDYGYSKSDFESYIAANELQLAMDELSGVIEDNPSPGPQFWSLLISAAEAMNLGPEKDRYESILKACNA